MPHHPIRAQAYWKGHGYYAFGVGAASFLRGVRFTRPRSMVAWRRYVAGLADACGVAPAGAHEPARDYWAGAGGAALGTHDRMLECIMLLLRTADGVPLAWFARAFGDERAAALLRGVERHLAAGRALVAPAGGPSPRDLKPHQTAALLAASKGNERLSLRLSEEGLLVSNDIISDAFAALT